MEVASLSFITPSPLYDVEKPYAIQTPLGDDVPREALSNLRYTQHDDIPLTDARSLPEQSLSYEEQGFKFIRHPMFSAKRFSADPAAVESYCQQTVDLISDEFRADKTICYDFRVSRFTFVPLLHPGSIMTEKPQLRRNRTSPSLYRNSDDKSSSNAAPPVHSVHIDHTKTSGFDRMRRYLTASEADKYLNGDYRARIVKYVHTYAPTPTGPGWEASTFKLNADDSMASTSVWRPINHAVEDCPLALCDARTISDDECLAADRVASADFVLELYYPTYSPRQEWYWLSNQTPREATVFVQFDSLALEKEGPVGGTFGLSLSLLLDLQFESDIWRRGEEV
ncbi:cytochrome p450 [Diplodia corticola]|uniref:Cytochrome p450 n=1 Tax=Diplodia corticola TaxID=236234 RepID=A0A1J9R9P7_9PEZI|nr:cytochrome p450 [Diplodia corticola]OJD37209.1 cytochrome p450 [Diplodia corticola]